MALENVLQRLADSRTFARKEVLRAKVMRRIHPPLLTLTRDATAPRDPLGLRHRVLARIAHPAVRRRFQALHETLTPSFDLLLQLKEHILGRIAAVQPAPQWHGALRFIAVTALLALVIRITPTLFLAPTLQATSEHLLIPTEGFVSITKGAEWNRVEGRMDLTEPLTVRTGPESAATIVLGDAAVLRLGENTEVNLRASAFAPPQEGRESIARVIYGQLWAASLLPDTLGPTTSLVLPQGTFALRHGSISILADPHQSTLQVFHRFAEVTPGAGARTHLIEGDQVTLLADGTLEHHLITEKMRLDTWVQVNRARDAAHRLAVEERGQELAEAAAGILPTSTFYSLKRAAEQVDLLWTFGASAKAEKRLQHAQTRLNEAVVLLNKGKPEAAESSLSEYREAIRELASLTEEEVRELLTSSLISSTTAVASALPHSPLYDVKKALVETTAIFPSADIPIEEVDLYLLSDALLEIEGLIGQERIEEAAEAFHSIEGAVASVLNRQELSETKVEKDSLKALKTILRSIAFSLEDAEETIHPELASTLADLQLRIAGRLPPEARRASARPGTALASAVPCMSLREVTRHTNQFLASVYTYETPRGQRNEVLRQISLLPDCPQSGRILSKVMNKVPVFTRSFVWEALQKIGAGT